MLNRLFGKLIACKEYLSNEDTIVNIIDELSASDKGRKFEIFVSNSIVGNEQYKVWILMTNDRHFFEIDKYDIPTAEMIQSNTKQIIRTYDMSDIDFPDKGVYIIKMFSMLKSDYDELSLEKYETTDYAKYLTDNEERCLIDIYPINVL